MTIEWEELPDAAAEILRRFAPGPIPLQQTGACPPEAAKVAKLDPHVVFGAVRDPQAALSGLMLLLGCWEKSHAISQDCDSREGSYWHAIAHRIEPDTPNAGYWFRRVGEHPIFEELHTQAQEILSATPSLGWRLGSRWQPMRFLEWCDEARGGESSAATHAATLIQNAECKLLLGWCAQAR